MKRKIKALFNPKEVGKRIIKLRGVESRADFGKRYGKTGGWIYHVESGRSRPQLGFLLRLSDEYGVSVDYILKGEKSKKDKNLIKITLALKNFLRKSKKIQEELENEL